MWYQCQWNNNPLVCGFLNYKDKNVKEYINKQESIEWKQEMFKTKKQPYQKAENNTRPPKGLQHSEIIHHPRPMFDIFK